MERLSAAEFAASVNTSRFKVVADYPHRAHLFGDSFFSANDGGLHATASASFVPGWPLRPVRTGSRAGRASPPSLPSFRTGGQRACRHRSRLMSTTPDASNSLPPETEPNGCPTSRRHRAGAVAHRATADDPVGRQQRGAPQSQRSGHFMAAIDGQWIIPDLGAPTYATDFFGPRRYTTWPRPAAATAARSSMARSNAPAAKPRARAAVGARRRTPAWSWT